MNESDTVDGGVIRKPENVVLLTIDALRADSFEHIEKSLPSELNTVTVENCFATGPGTSTAFPGIMTSTYPLEYEGYSGVGEDRTTIATVLRRNGYETGGFHSNPLLSEDFGYEAGFETFYDSIGTKRRLNRLLNEYAPSAVHEFVKNVYYRLKDFDELPYDRAEDINNRASRWLRNADSDAFCWVHYMDPHHPYKPPVEYTDVSESYVNELWHQLNDDPTELTDEDVDVLWTLYEQEIEYLRDELSGFLEEQYEEGHLDDTLLVVMADHGEEFRDHGDLLHRPKLHDELVNVPLLFAGDVVERGAHLDETVSSIDVPATILDLLDITPPSSYRGKNIFDPSVTRESCFSELSHESGAGGAVKEDRIKVACRTSEWTYIYSRQSESQRLYEPGETPKEQTDVSAENPDAVAEMESKVESHLDTVLRKTTSRDDRESVDDEIESRLADLGYK